MAPCRALLGVLSLLIASAWTTARAEHPDISWMTYTGAGSCVSPCHIGGAWNMEETARAFTHSLHFRLQASVPAQSFYERSGAAVTGEHGMANRLDALAGTLAGQEWLGRRQDGNPNLPGGEAAGCARCHASTGRLAPADLVEDNWQSVDCLICHALDYRVDGQSLTDAAARLPVADPASPTGWRLLLPAGPDLGATSRSIAARPDVAACQRCHLSADHGYLQRSGTDFALHDHHAGSLTCASCHVSDGHHLLGGGPKPTQWAIEGAGTPAGSLVTCAGCHSSAGQAARPDLDIVVPTHPIFAESHFERIACETCHIPVVRGLAWQAFDRLERVVEGGRFRRWQPSRGMRDAPEPPVYLWTDGSSWTDDQPRGQPWGAGSRITPFRRVDARMPRDLASGRLLPLDLAVIGDADSLMTNFVASPLDTAALLDLAVRRGVAAAAEVDAANWGSLVDGGGDYTGAWGFVDRPMDFPVNHGVTHTAGQVLRCMDCHWGGTALDWQELGYAGDPAVVGAVDDRATPDDFWLGPCRPNPFNGATIVPFQLARPAAVTLAVYDLQGRPALEVMRDQPLAAGRHEAQIAADRLPSGVYIYRLDANGRQRAGKMVLVK